jgi:hypothetical protein
MRGAGLCYRSGARSPLQVSSSPRSSLVSVARVTPRIHSWRCRSDLRKRWPRASRLQCLPGGLLDTRVSAGATLLEVWSLPSTEVDDEAPAFIDRRRFSGRCFRQMTPGLGPPRPAQRESFLAESLTQTVCHESSRGRSPNGVAKRFPDWTAVGFRWLIAFHAAGHA